MTTKPKCTPIKVNGRTVAVLRGSVLDVRRTPAGILNTPPAIALAVSLVCQAEALGCVDILVSVGENVTYRTTLEAFKENAFPIRRGGFEKQLACPLECFVGDLRVESKALLPGEVRFRKAEASQPTLFRLGGAL